MSEWIPVSERLPEPATMVLIWDNRFHEPRMACLDSREFGRVRYWCGYCRSGTPGTERDAVGKAQMDGKTVSDNITHWMPLPETPQ